MFNPARSLILTLLKVPPEPHPPAGSPGSLRVFRAGKNYFKLKLAGWVFAQLLALAGIVFWVGVFINVEIEVHKRREANQESVSPRSVHDFEEFIKKVGADQPAGDAEAAKPESQQEQPEKAPRKRVRINGWDGFKRLMVEVAMWLPPWGLPALWALKIAGIVIYIVQIPITYFLRRLDFEMRWYIVTDRSLRLRWGVAKVQETTMSFANLQQVELMQNPIQRLLGLGDVRVQSAGGGSGGGSHEAHGQDSMHRAHFHAVDNAHEIRDLILERLRSFRQAGLGDPDDPHHAEEDPAAPPPQPAGSALDAAREVLAEVRALRASIQS